MVALLVIYTQLDTLNSYNYHKMVALNSLDKRDKSILWKIANESYMNMYEIELLFYYQLVLKYNFNFVHGIIEKLHRGMKLINGQNYI